MVRRADVRGGNGDIVFNIEKGTARKYLRNTSSLEKIQRFKRELDVFKMLGERDVSNIVKVIDVYIDEENIKESYIEMEKYDGSLYDILEITKGNIRMTFTLILPVIRALYKLSVSAPPLLHRDVKPDNILYRKAGEKITLFLSDFGTCFLNDGSERITPETIAVGPRMFIAPEYEIGRVEYVTEKGDIFSIGKVIWCMINGKEGEYLPSNYWFIDDYNLTKKFPDNKEMIIANTVIASCLNVNPEERCDYQTLIIQIESILSENEISITQENQYKVRLYQEKRNVELLEIKEKNRLLVNFFSQCYVTALEKLVYIYSGFDLIKVLLEEYKTKSKDGLNYDSINVENNSAHYLYSRTYDRIYFSINYNPASGNERYCNISIHYSIATIKKDGTAKFYYVDNGAIFCEYNGNRKILSEISMEKIVDSIITVYVG